MHRVLQGAVNGLPAAARPQGPFHLGGALPQLGFHELLEVACLAVDAAARYVSPEEAVLFTDARTLAERALASSHDPALNHQYGRLRSRVASLPRTSIVGDLLDAVKDTLYSSLSAGRPRLFTRAVRLVVKADGVPAGRSLVTELDEALCRLDAQSLLERVRHRPSAPLVATLARGSDTHATTALVVALRGPRYGLLRQVHRAWEWIEGTRDDVFPLVPDALMAMAVERAVRLEHDCAE
jgi:hypothetical protein